MADDSNAAQIVLMILTFSLAFDKNHFSQNDAAYPQPSKLFN